MVSVQGEEGFVSWVTPLQVVLHDGRVPVGGLVVFGGCVGECLTGSRVLLRVVFGLDSVEVRDAGL